MLSKLFSCAKSTTLVVGSSSHKLWVSLEGSSMNSVLAKLWQMCIRIGTVNSNDGWLKWHSQVEKKTILCFSKELNNCACSSKSVVKRVQKYTWSFAPMFHLPVRPNLNHFSASQKTSLARFWNSTILGIPCQGSNPHFSTLARTTWLADKTNHPVNGLQSHFYYQIYWFKYEIWVFWLVLLFKIGF